MHYSFNFTVLCNVHHNARGIGISLVFGKPAIDQNLRSSAQNAQEESRHHNLDQRPRVSLLMLVLKITFAVWPFRMCPHICLRPNNCRMDVPGKGNWIFWMALVSLLLLVMRILLYDTALNERWKFLHNFWMVFKLCINIRRTHLHMQYLWCSGFNPHHDIECRFMSFAEQCK